MAQGKPQLKFERNPCNNFRDNQCHRRTTDKIPYNKLCSQSQAELKIKLGKTRLFHIAFKCIDVPFYVSSHLNHLLHEYFTRASAFDLEVLIPNPEIFRCFTYQLLLNGMDVDDFMKCCDNIRYFKHIYKASPSANIVLLVKLFEHMFNCTWPTQFKYRYITMNE